MEGVIHIHVMASLCYVTFFDTPWEHAKLTLDLLHLQKIWVLSCCHRKWSTACFPPLGLFAWTAGLKYTVQRVIY